MSTHDVPHVGLDYLYPLSAEQCQYKYPIWTGGYCGENDESLQENGKGKKETNFRRYLQRYRDSMTCQEAAKIHWVSHWTFSPDVNI